MADSAGTQLPADASASETGNPGGSAVSRVLSSHSSVSNHGDSISSCRLPAQTTSFIGREREVQEVVRLLLSPQIRLVTLTGPGGIGKTRLAIEVGSNLEATFKDGVFFVSLAPIREHDVAVSAIARAVGLMEGANRPLLDALKDHLRDKETLLILDNSEQVLAASLVASELLAASANLKLLVTSRATLTIRGEHQFEVPALGLPLSIHPAVMEEVERCDAVRLFVERAQAARRDFALTGDNVEDVAEICRRLEGIPLAIELAAARIRLFTPQSMLSRLENRLKLLTGGPEDLPERQRTIRNTIAWSYELLDHGEQQLFRRLSVFSGGCNLESMEAVCGHDLAVEPLEGLDSLVRKSLVKAGEQANEIRFSMLETVREYGQEMLEASGEAPLLRMRHSQFFKELADVADPELTGPRQGQWLKRLEADHDNLRETLRFALNNDPEVAVRVAGCIWRFWGNYGHLTEGRRWLAQCLEMSSEPSPERARALRGAGNLAWRESDYHAARRLQQESLAICRDNGDQRGTAAALNNLAGVAMYEGDRATARSLYEEALEIYRQMDDRTNVAVILTNLGVTAEEQGNLAVARRRLEEGLAISRELRDGSRMALALYNLSIVAMRAGDLAGARDYGEESLAISRELGDKFAVAPALGLLGEIALKRGDFDLAKSCLMENLSQERDLNDRRGMAQAFRRMSALAVAKGSPERAARLLGVADALRESTHAAMSPGEQADQAAVVAACRQKLGNTGFATAWGEGFAMSPTEATNYTLAATSPDLPEHQRPADQGAIPLSQREREVVSLVAAGLSNAEIAEKLVISPRTAETHVNHILNKLGFSSRIQIATWALQKGLAAPLD